MIEIWKLIKGYEGLYSISSFGQVRRDKTGKILTPRITTKFGIRTYGGVALYKYFGEKCYIRKEFKIARLVAEAFIGPRPAGYHIDHLDCNKLNDRADNLEYVTPLENARRAWRNGCYQNRHFITPGVCHL